MMDSTRFDAKKPSVKVYPTQLLSALEYYAPSIKVLSLDCFDTLLWRMTEKPTDVFFDLEQSPAFQSIGLTANLRSQSEAKLRQLRWITDKTTEVKLEDIYREHLPALTQEQIELLTSAEITAEERICYAFTPMINLIRTANAKKIKIIIVSDTYFTENQIRKLFAHTLPQDVIDMISNVFCSCEYNRSKTNNLFNDVLHTLNVKPENILHIGDNLAADYISARTLNMHALHFIQDNDYVKDVERLHSMAANLINPAIRTNQPLYNPFRALFATSGFTIDKPEFLLGYYSLGPIMYCFAKYIIDEIDNIRSTGKQSKVLFLMRDGYLPALACEAYTGKSIGYSVVISRFAAIAASFQTEENIDRYLTDILQANRFHDIARQLLLPKKVAEPIIEAANKHDEPESEFVRLLHRPDVLRIIFKKSAEYRSRLMCYLKKKIDLTQGDHLVFVDLGYAGTTQRLLSPLFHEMGISVEGRYLIALEATKKETFRAGLLDTSHYDNKTLHSILHFIALFEKLCTSNEKSVIDYSENGDPIYSEIGISEQQQIKLSAIQSEAIRFIQHAKNFFNDITERFSDQLCRNFVSAELARLIYLPTPSELHYLQSFQFDFNLGMKDVRQLFDPKKALDGLKRRGLFYIDRNTTTNRTNYPAELRIAGFELALTFMSQIRFDLDASLNDMSPRREFIEAHIATPHQVYPVTLGAYSTHDGYYSVWAEAGTSITFSMGKRYQWLQIESAELIPSDAFFSQRESGHSLDVKQLLAFNQIQDHRNGLIECLSETSSISMASNKSTNNTNYIFRLVYRPVIYQRACHASMPLASA